MKTQQCIQCDKIFTLTDADNDPKVCYFHCEESTQHSRKTLDSCGCVEPGRRQYLVGQRLSDHTYGNFVICPSGSDAELAVASAMD